MRQKERFKKSGFGGGICWHPVVRHHKWHRTRAVYSAAVKFFACVCCVFTHCSCVIHRSVWSVALVWFTVLSDPPFSYNSIGIYSRVILNSIGISSCLRWKFMKTNFAQDIEKYVKFSRLEGFFSKFLRIFKTLKNHISEKQSWIKNVYGRKCRKCS